VKVSVGVSGLRPGLQADTLRAEADAALYEAKRHGGNGSAHFKDLGEHLTVLTADGRLPAVIRQRRGALKRHDLVSVEPFDAAIQSAQTPKTREANREQGGDEHRNHDGELHRDGKPRMFAHHQTGSVSEHTMRSISAPLRESLSARTASGLRRLST
jgi:hypothetical protein